MAQTEDQLVEALVIGTSLGVLAQGVDATSAKVSLELAFNHAWRSWPEARCFPSIKGHNPKNFLWTGLGKLTALREIDIEATWDSADDSERRLMAKQFLRLLQHNINRRIEAGHRCDIEFA